MNTRLERFEAMRKAAPRGLPTITQFVQMIEPWVVTVAIFLLPMRFLRSSVGLFTLSDLFLAASFLLLLAGRRFPLAPLGKLTWMWLGACAAITAGLLVSSLLMGDVLRGLNVISQYFYTLTLLPFVLFGRDRAMTIRLVKTLVFSVVFIEALGIFAYVTGWNPTGRMVSGSKRLMSLMEEANANACLIAMTIPLVLYLWQARYMSNWIALLFVLPILFIALVLTSSVTGLSSALLGIGVFVAASLRPKMFGRALAIIAGLALLFAIGGSEILPKTFQRRVLAPLESGDIEAAGTFSDRIILMREALVVIERNPFVGVGADQFRKVSSSRQPVHNIYLLFWVEGGVLTLIGWMAILLVGGAAALEAYMTREYRLTGAAAFSLVIVLTFIGINTPYMYGRYWMVPFMLAVALAINAVAMMQTPKTTIRRS